MPELFQVLYEDAELLAINKPAGLVCHPTKGDAYSSLISRLRLHVGEGTPAHLVNRLDRETSGVVLAVKGDKRVGKIKQLFAEREVNKEYLAIVHGHVAAESGCCAEPLGRDEQSVVAVKDCVRPDGSAARTDFVVERRFERPAFLPLLGERVGVRAGEVASLDVGCSMLDVRCSPVPSTHSPPQASGSSSRITHYASRSEPPPPPSTINSPPSTLLPFSLLRVQPHSGRKHQIRIHLAHLGHPIVGDKIYGGDERLYLDFVERRLTAEQRRRLILPCHALHAESLRFNWLLKEWIFRAEPEPWFTDFVEGRPCTSDWSEKYR